MGTRWLGVVGAVVAGVWIVGVTGVAQSGGWLVQQYALIEQTPLPAWTWAALGAANGALVALPALLVRVLARRDGLRATGTAWLLAAAALVLLTPLRAIPDAQPALGYAAIAAACGLLTATLRATRRPSAKTASPAGSAGPADAASTAGAAGADRADGVNGAAGLGAGGVVPAAVGAGLVALLPWLAVGAFGDLLDLGTGVLAAVGFGALAGTVLSGRFWDPLRGRVLAGGAAAAVALVVLCAGIGQGGAQLALLGGVPVLGLAVAAAGGTGRGVGAAVGIAAAGPLTLVAPAQLSLLLGTRDVAWYALLATAATLVLGLAVGVGYAVRARLEARKPLRVLRFGWAAATVGLVAAAVVYPTAGHPGLHGNRLLVVLRAQADLTRVGTASGPAGRVARADAVYRTLVDTARRNQAPLRRALTDRGIGFRPYYLVDAVEVDSAGPELRRWLSARPDVDRVLLGPRLRPIPRRPTPTAGTEPAPQAALWNISLTGADRVVRDLGVNGRGI
ncbi:MAG TPA: peptidase S8, partial [Actinocatenispora sp.]